MLQSKQRYPFIIWENNIIDEGYVKTDKISECDVVFVCLYPNQTISFIKDHVNQFKRDAIIMDVSGVKRHMINRLEMYFDDDFDVTKSICIRHEIAHNRELYLANNDHNINYSHIVLWW